MVVTDGAARLRNVLHTGFPGTLHIVSKREKGVTAAGHTGLRGDPGLLLLSGQNLRLCLEDLLPGALSKNILVFV